MEVLKCTKGTVECSILDDDKGSGEPLLELQVSNELKLIGDVKPSVIKALREELTVKNPEWVKFEQLGRYNGHINEHREFLERHNGYWTMPQGYMDRLIMLLMSHSCPFDLDFPLRTSISGYTEYEFQGELRSNQKLAADAALHRPYGVLCLPTGAGKTVVALYCIAKRIQTALIVVHRKEILNQWQERITEFLGIPKAEIGVIEGGKWKIGEKVTVAMIQSLASKKRDISELVNRTSFLVVDECHHVPAEQFQRVVSQFRCRYMLGLSATPEREDGFGDVTHFFLGDLLYVDSPERSFQRGDTLRPIVYTVKTDFDFNYSGNYTDLLAAMIEDSARLDSIVQSIGYFIAYGGTPLIVSDRVEYCKKIAEGIEQLLTDVQVGLLTGGVSKPKREKVIAGINSGELCALVATGSIASEGLDCKKLDGLFIATPFKAAAKVKQMVGRIVRPAKGKKTPEIHDFVDEQVWKCQTWYQERRAVYEEQGYSFG